MALYAFDGTWNTERDHDPKYENTNVSRFYDAYHTQSARAVTLARIWNRTSPTQTSTRCTYFEQPQARLLSPLH